MTRSSLSVLLLAAASLALACEGREIAVFELPAVVVGGAGAGGGAGAAAMAGSPSNAGVGGTRGDVMTAGSSSGASDAGGSLSTSAGSAGDGNGNANGNGNDGMAGGGGGGPPPCGADSDCMPGWLCEKRGCESLTGVCVPWPVFCPPNPAPVCGCDGVTYWNDCIRLQSHARLQAFDQCRATACTCEVGADCMVPYASCSHLLPPGEMCGHGMGACWVLPPDCESIADSKMWRECKPPDVGEVPACLNTCQAIATEHSYAELHRNESCN